MAADIDYARSKSGATLAQTSPADDSSRRQMALACKILYVEGQNDFNHGQISARRPGSDQFWIRAAARGFDEITNDDFVLSSNAGERLYGSGHIPPEWPIHSEIYAARPEVNSIVHTHPKAAIAFSSLGKPIRPLSHDGAFFFPHVPVFRATTNTITDPAMAKKLVDTLGGAKGVLLKNHGIVTVGTTIREATIAALLLERAAELELMVAGQSESSPSPDADVPAKQKFIFDPVAMRTYWDYYSRKVVRIEAGRQLSEGHRRGM